MKNCNKCIFLEGRKQGDIYMWMSNVPDGPSVKFLMENGTVQQNIVKTLSLCIVWKFIKFFGLIWR